ncbi:hypothetical protein EDD15DRAFT_2373878 [Pisolithus albus]|nr:hypothetical protein EDD15DRAFT_2373878 [Pisolithus albus]
MDTTESPAAFDARSTRARDYWQFGGSDESGGDDLFHFSPLAELHEKTISPICRPFRTDLLSSNVNKSQHPSSLAEIGRKSEPSDAECEPVTSFVPPPCDSMEAYLLLEVARSDRQISLKQKDLAYEIVHCNTVALQLNRIVLTYSSHT